MTWANFKGAKRRPTFDLLVSSLKIDLKEGT